jgi:hypothetical protein
VYTFMMMAMTPSFALWLLNAAGIKAARV